MADIFTKALGAEKLRRFRTMLGLYEMQSSRGSVEMSSSTPRAGIHYGPWQLPHLFTGVLGDRHEGSLPVILQLDYCKGKGPMERVTDHG